ncbi:MAG: prepilin-type N-terminal cleavage/methylation domain-containing protein [Planctomycetota bacterium]
MKQRQKGFTIIEMLIVVSILAMLTAILVPVLDDSAKSSRDARRAADLKSVQAALEAYKRENGVYPSTNNQWWGDAPSYGGKDYQGAKAYIPGMVPNFMPSLPKDPDPQYPSGDKGYLYRSDGKNYKFLANKTPESFKKGNPFYDPKRKTFAWQISTPGGYKW